ncbi:hypothetical protein [Bifidobacterium avesanii]|uniref:Teichoic acid transporter n=1 Tax=Bifidobacterium avesanii TaxID=1798157 RepID=A0A7K3TG58_9BIFI|nr:hypothetical protein [Bifidobacterium avesanii]KAB8294576.1 teichoic acid transporter [Bifidobacterium avesanii]NEG78087.1 hypothetical protein [Bifidobacterium avesanii]
MTGEDAARHGRDDGRERGPVTPDEERSDELFEAAAKQPQSDLSLADVERRRFHPLAWIGFFALVLAAVVAPYGVGRDLAMNHTGWVMAHMDMFEPRGIALASWAVTLFAFTGLGMAVVQTKRWVWRFVFVIALAAEQFLAGVCLLRSNFWYATYVVYGRNAQLANAGDLGIIAAGAGVAAFALLFVAILVLIRKDSPLNVLTRSWAAFSLFFVVEMIALAIVLFGGLLTTV